MFKLLMVLVLKNQNASCTITTSQHSLLGKQDLYGGPGRREIGHGALGERAFLAVIPS